MLIAIDYDNTYTRDPDYWDEVIRLGIARGHQYICVTGRPWLPNTTKKERIPNILILASGDEFKDDYARANGYIVSVWIDDKPGTINGREHPTLP